MIFELRSYEFAPAQAPAYLSLFQSAGLTYITRHLPMLGYWLTETGGLNQLHHLWVYRDLGDRTQRRIGASADSDWTGGFAPRGFPMIKRQTSRIMTLVRGSALLDDAVKAADRVHAAIDEKAPVVTPAWAALTVHPAGALEMVSEEGLVGHWAVLSGAAPGTTVSIHNFPSPEAVTYPTSAVISHELMRPTSFSPL